MFLKAISSGLSDEQKKIINYYNKIPTFTDLDNNAIYFLKNPIILPSMSKSERQLVIENGIFYNDTTVLIFKSNGQYSCFEIKDNTTFEDLGFAAQPVLKFETEEDVQKIKETLLDDNYNVLGFIIQNSKKSKKEFIFQMIYKGTTFVAVTDKNFITLIPIKYLKQEEVGSFMSVEKIPYVFKRMLKHKEEELLFISSFVHKCGGCQPIFLTPENKKIPDRFLFYFYLVRVVDGKKIIKLFLSTSDCPVTTSSIQNP